MSQLCFKRDVLAVIIDKNGKIATGRNLIYASGLTECPRSKGEGYEKCKFVCDQHGHGETEAIKEGIKLGLELKGAKIYLIGHYRLCDDCKLACDSVGLEVVILGEK